MSYPFQGIAITGTRAPGELPAGLLLGSIGAFLGPMPDKRTHVYVGGATGMDTLVLGWLAFSPFTRPRDILITVAVPHKLSDQPADARAMIEKAQQAGRLNRLVELDGPAGPEAYHARNRWMVDRASLVIGFPLADRPKKGGTWATLDYAERTGKARLIVPVPAQREERINEALRAIQIED